MRFSTIHLQPERVCVTHSHARPEFSAIHSRRQMADAVDALRQSRIDNSPGAVARSAVFRVFSCIERDIVREL